MFNPLDDELAYEQKMDQVTLQLQELILDAMIAALEKIRKRNPVHQIIRMLANGDKIQELTENYPSIKVEDIYACLDYAASLAEEQITPIDMTESAI